MILNAKHNNFVILFSQNFFYPEVEARWKTVIDRMKLPYNTTVDFLNACIQSVSFPSLQLTSDEQQERQNRIVWRGGKELEPQFDKTLTVSFKLSEGFISYWMLFEQIEWYLTYGKTLPFWPPMFLSFLDHNGHSLMEFSYEQVTPIGLSQFDVNYSTMVSEFASFSLTLKFNRFKIKRGANQVSPFTNI
jgi:hypothetical protein